MSDLAPFVAAAIKDRAMLELIAENKRLKEENETKRLREEKEERLKVRITGKNGAPIYHEVSLLGGKKIDFDEFFGCAAWEIDLPAHNDINGDEIGFVQDFELWFGGNLLKGYKNVTHVYPPAPPGVERRLLSYYCEREGVFKFLGFSACDNSRSTALYLRRVTFPFQSMILPILRGSVPSEERLKVRITGSNGTPVYHEASLLGGKKIGFDQSLGCESWVVELPRNIGTDGYEIGLGHDTFLRDFQLWFGGGLLMDYQRPQSNSAPPHVEKELRAWEYVPKKKSFKLEGYMIWTCDESQENKIFLYRVIFPFRSMIAPLLGLTE